MVLVVRMAGSACNSVFVKAAELPVESTESLTCRKRDVLVFAWRYMDIKSSEALLTRLLVGMP